MCRRVDAGVVEEIVYTADDRPVEYSANFYYKASGCLFQLVRRRADSFEYRSLSYRRLSSLV